MLLLTQVMSLCLVQYLNFNYFTVLELTFDQAFMCWVVVSQKVRGLEQKKNEIKSIIRHPLFSFLFKTQHLMTGFLLVLEFEARFTILQKRPHLFNR